MLVYVEAISPTGAGSSSTVFDGTLGAFEIAPIEVDLAALGFSKSATETPVQVILRAYINGNEDEIVWSPPIHLHFDAQEKVHRLYDRKTLEDVYGNGDLEGDLAVPGATPGTEYISGSGEKVD